MLMLIVICSYQVAHEAFIRFKRISPVLIRFCGTSPESRNARNLLISLCFQLEHLFSLKAKIVSLKNGSYAAIVSYFHELLKKHAVLVFIDSLDQLSDEDQGRSQISFLKDLQTHPDTRIVVSCLPDDKEINPETGKRYVYMCDTRLQEGHVPRVTVQMSTESKEKASDEAMFIVHNLLMGHGRTLTKAQHVIVRSKIAEEKEKTALILIISLYPTVCLQQGWRNQSIR